MNYYKMPTESIDGEDGYYFYEVVECRITRQIFVFGTKRYWATRHDWKDDSYMFTDQPEHESPAINSVVIAGTEFEHEWRLSQGN